MEKAFKNTTIAFKFMEYEMTLKSFFKDEFKSGQFAYLIPFSHVLYTKRTIFQYIRDSCEYVCPLSEQCKGHQFLNYVNMLWNATCWGVEQKKVYYKYFYFTNFEVVRTINGYEIKGWDAKPVEPEDLSHLSYSKRMSYLL